MSYNVDRWVTKELESLVIPVASLTKHPRTDWHPSHTIRQDGRDEFAIMDDVFVLGKVYGDTLYVDEIKASGEGSGTALNWILEPALRDSMGKLVASRVWEGGDSIDRLTVIDGQLSTAPIDI